MDTAQVISLVWSLLIKVTPLAGIVSGMLATLGCWLILRFTKPLDSYSEELAKHLARHQNLEKLVEETRRVTDAAERIKSELLRETERIKSELSHDNWDRQTRWAAKRDLYVQIAQALGDLHAGYFEWKSWERRRRSAVSEQQHAEIVRRGNESLRKIDLARESFLHARDTAPLMIPDEPLKPLREFRPKQTRFGTPDWEADLE